MKRHFVDIARFHAVFDGLLEQCRPNTITPVWFQNRNRHDVALLRAVLLSVFLARDGANKHIFYVRKLRVPTIVLQVIVKALRVDYRQGQIVQNAHLLEILGREFSKLDVKLGNLALWLFLLVIVKLATIRRGQLAKERDFVT